MNKTFALLINSVLLFVFTFSHAQTYAQGKNKVEQIAPSDQVFEIKFQELEGKKHVLIGFKKEEGELGNTYILDSKGTVVNKYENFEMIYYPAFNAIDVSNFQSGSYTVRILTARNNTYETQFAIE